MDVLVTLTVPMVIVQIFLDATSTTQSSNNMNISFSKIYIISYRTNSYTPNILSLLHLGDCNITYL